MKQKAVIISGWGYDAESMRPPADQLMNAFDIELLSGMDVLKSRSIPDADVIIGWSMGGMLAMELLPASCSKLVLISSTAKFCAANDYPCGIHEKALRRMILQLKRNPEAVLSEFYKNASHPHPTNPANGWNGPNLTSGLEYLLEADLREAVKNIKIPVLLLHGTQDQIIPAAASEWLHENLPVSTLEIFNEDGHTLALHQTDKAAKLIQQTCSRLSG